MKNLTTALKGIALIGILCSFILGCSDRPVADVSGKPLIVTSIPPLASVARSIGGDGIEVKILIDRMSDPHSFDLKPSQAAELEKASLVLLVGGGYEPWSRSLSEAKVLSIHDSLPNDYRQIEHNNHYWLDPEAIRFFAKELSVKMIELKISGVDVRLQKFESDLTYIQQDIDTKISRWRKRGYFSTHPTWSYFANRFMLNELGCLRSEHGRELGAKSTIRLYELAKDPLHKVLFREVHEPMEVVSSFISDTGSQLVTLDALGDGVESYPDLLQRNVKAMSKAMRE